MTASTGSRVVPYEEFRLRRERYVPRLPFGPPKPRLTLAEAAHRLRMLGHLSDPRRDRPDPTRVNR